MSAAIDDLVRRTDPGPMVPSHGDFYEANLLMAGGRVSGLLDVDALGPGHLVDDLACFLGHLAVLPAVNRRYVHAPAALEHFGDAFERCVEPAALHARAAGVALTLVAGAKRRTADGSEAPGWAEDARARLDAAAALEARARRLLR
ncbi:phosphotransferase [Arthrobacter sp. CAN_A214]|uniref:phosphotransferase n=1 Tax=Arthrobacter sp. CAN_A214 TaxID=2787720 RepID=UPI003FA416B5